MKKVFYTPLLLLLLFSCKKDKSPGNSALHTTTTFTIPADSVTLNPSGNAPLSALVHFASPQAGYTEVRVKGKTAAAGITQVFNDSGTTHSIPILGLYANYDNTVEVYVINSKKDSLKSTLHITTGPLPANLPNYIHTDIMDLAHMEPGLNLVSSLSGYPATPVVPYIVDAFGDIRWCLDFTNNPQLNKLFYDCGIARLQNGNYRFADGASEKIYEVDILGKIIKTWGLGGYTFHHDVYEKPNGNFLVTVTSPNGKHTDGSPTIEDYIIEIDRQSGNIVTTWDLKESLNEYRTTLNTDPVDWIHTNALIYDPADNTIIISGRVQGVVKLTNDNHVKWILGAHRGWGKNRRGEDLDQFLLKPLDASGKPIIDTAVINGWTNSPDFEWNWYQHSPIIKPDGDLMLFDNGDIRNYNPNATTHYSRAVEYKIDENNMTVQQKWAYGESRGEETFSRIISSVRFYPDMNHVIFAPGFNVPNTTGHGGKIVEVDYATQKVVFQQSISSANLFGFHRAFRVPLYPNANPYK